MAAAILCAVQDAVPIQAPASVFVIPSAAVRGFDAGVSGGLDAGGAGRVGKNAAACSVDIDFGAAAVCSSAGGAVVCQVMNPDPSGVVPSSLVEGANVSSNCPRYDVPPYSPFATPLPRHLGSLTATNSVSFDLNVSCSSC